MNASPSNKGESINYSQLGYLRVAASTPSLVIGDATANAQSILQQANDLAAQGVALGVFPELCLTGYSAEDLFFSERFTGLCCYSNGVLYLYVTFRRSPKNKISRPSSPRVQGATSLSKIMN